MAKDKVMKKVEDPKKVAVDKAMDVKAEAEKAEAPQAAEKKQEAAPAPKAGKKTVAMKDDTNMGTFAIGQEIELKDYKFMVKEVSGLEIVLKRTDIK